MDDFSVLIQVAFFGQMQLRFDVATGSELAQRIVSEFETLSAEPSPFHQLYKLEAISWWLVGFAAKSHLPPLWKQVCQLMVVTNSVTLRQWGEINEYIAERIGEMLFRLASDHGIATAVNVENALN